MKPTNYYMKHPSNLGKPVSSTIKLPGIYFLSLIAMISVLFISCTKKDISETAETEFASKAKQSLAQVEPLGNYTGLDKQTAWELQQARAATARYQHIKNAIKDGYTDINVVMMNMGHHFMKMEHVDATFNIREPELLVYNKHADGHMELVAVEYAVPLNLSANAPEGFTGTDDVWDENTSFGLWLLHAWVWKYNPDGVFKPMNPDVHTF